MVGCLLPQPTQPHSFTLILIKAGIDCFVQLYFRNSRNKIVDLRLFSQSLIQWLRFDFLLVLMCAFEVCGLGLNRPF